MLLNYIVINKSLERMKGVTQVDGENIPFERDALFIEATPEVQDTRSGTLSLVLVGAQIAELKAADPGDVLSLDVRLVKHG